MKTVNFKDESASSKCLLFRHLSLIAILSLTLISSSAFSLEYKVATSRAPASAFDEEVLTVPLEQKVMVQSIFAEDDAGVMRGMRDSLNAWQETEDYAQRWDLKSTHLYNTPTTKEKRVYITKNLMRYADKRLAGEMKNAEEGSALHAVGNVEKSLRVNASVPVTKYISFKFKARVLQGKAIMDVRNPWVDCSATVGVNGKAKILTKKDFNQLGTSTGAEYNINESQWVAFVDQEITKNIKARVSSTTMTNGDDADKKVEMMASFPFNL
jgi:hypothetical protein